MHGDHIQVLRVGTNILTRSRWVQRNADVIVPHSQINTNQLAIFIYDAFVGLGLGENGPLSLQVPNLSHVICQPRYQQSRNLNASSPRD